MGGGLDKFIEVDSMHINMLMNMCIYNVFQSGLHAVILIAVQVRQDVYETDLKKSLYEMLL